MHDLLTYAPFHFKSMYVLLKIYMYSFFVANDAFVGVICVNLFHRSNICLSAIKVFTPVLKSKYQHCR